MNSSLLPSGDATSDSPTRTRYRVVAMAVLLAMVTYLDRVCISVLAPDIMRDLSLSKMQMSFVFSSFVLAYALFEIPTAWWADRLGTRKVLTRIVIWWSVFTIATATSLGYVMLLIIRFLFGAGEAGAWPSVAKTFAHWIPQKERGTVQGIFFAGAHIAGGLTPLLLVALTQVLGWRTIFVLFGCLGFFWAAGWYWWFRDDPSEHPQVNEAELAKIHANRVLGTDHGGGLEYWRRLLTSRNMIALCLMYFPNSCVFYFCITWLPTFLEEKHGFTATSLGFFAGLPLILSVFADFFGGVATDWAVARFGLRLGRSGLGCVAYILSGGAILLAIVAPHPILAAVLISFAVAASMFTLAAAWGTCIDVGGSHAGVVSAAMNTCGQIGSVSTPILVTMLVNHFGGWDAPLYLIAFLFLFGAICWCFIDPRRQVFE